MTPDAQEWERGPGQSELGATWSPSSGRLRKGWGGPEAGQGRQRAWPGPSRPNQRAHLSCAALQKPGPSTPITPSLSPPRPDTVGAAPQALPSLGPAELGDTKGSPGSPSVQHPQNGSRWGIWGLGSLKEMPEEGGGKDRENPSCQLGVTVCGHPGLREKGL